MGVPVGSSVSVIVGEGMIVEEASGVAEGVSAGRPVSVADNLAAEPHAVKITEKINTRSSLKMKRRCTIKSLPESSLSSS